MTAPGGPTDIRAHAAGCRAVNPAEQHAGKQIDAMEINVNISKRGILHDKSIR